MTGDSAIFRDNLLAGQKALVTGGGTGIGRVTALELAKLGVDVALVGRRPDPLNKVKAEIEALGRKALALPCDIRDVAKVGETVAAVVQDFGRIDILFNNAGGQFIKPSADMSENGWNAVIGANLSGTFFMSQQVAKQAMFKQKSGLIVNMIINMWRGIPGAAHSGAARAGIDNLTKTLSLEWAAHKIRVNAVAPGTVATEGLANYPPQLVQQLRSLIPLKQVGRSEDVAWMICYLASEAGRWITGETICIDGGSQNWGSMWRIPDDDGDKAGY